MKRVINAILRSFEHEFAIIDIFGPLVLLDMVEVRIVFNRLELEIVSLNRFVMIDTEYISLMEKTGRYYATDRMSHSIHTSCTKDFAQQLPVFIRCVSITYR